MNSTKEVSKNGTEVIKNGTEVITERYFVNRTIVNYKGRWNAIKCTIWIWICALLCTLYIAVGIPLLKYLNRSDDETEEVRPLK